MKQPRQAWIKSQIGFTNGFGWASLLEARKSVVAGGKMNWIKIGLISLFSLVMGNIAQAQSDKGDTILVLDASGSMWAKLGERHRIQIARDVFAQLMEELPPEQALGVVAYGHRRKSDCSDIQQIADFGTARNTMVKRVQKLNPRGKTPLAGALEFAAKRLDHTNAAANVVLVSDGSDTCRQDPCAMAKKLNASSADFTVHVVGFDISDKSTEAQLQCIADETGGAYYPAGNQTELAAAFSSAFAAEASAAPGTPALLTLRATELEAGPVISTGLTWTIKGSLSGKEIIVLRNAGPVALEVAPGLYDIHVRRVADGAEANVERMRVRPGVDRSEVLPLDFDFSASVRPFDGPELAVNSDVTVLWEGPARNADYLAIASVDAADDAYLTRTFVEPGKPASLPVPIDPGTYEIRYVLGEPPHVLARETVQALDVIALMMAPDTAPANGVLTVDWRGPGYEEDLLTIVPAGASEEELGNIVFTSAGQPAQLRVPHEPGLYELRYVLAGQRTLARRALEVQESDSVIVRLKAPDSTTIGSWFDIELEGPEGNLALVDGSGVEHARVDIAGAGPAKLQAPYLPGAFSLQYVDSNGASLVSAPIEIKDVAVDITAPVEVRASRPFLAKVSGPFFEGDLLMIADPGNPDAITDRLELVNEETRLQLLAPPRPGAYELRYLLRGKRVIASQVLDVRGKI